MVCTLAYMTGACGGFVEVYEGTLVDSGIPPVGGFKPWYT